MASDGHSPTDGPMGSGGSAATLLVIPSLGGPGLERCLHAVAALEPGPQRTVIVLSGTAPAPASPGVEVLRSLHRLPYSAAVNLGLEHRAADVDRVALLNDDAFPEPGWLGTLARALDADHHLAAVQGTVTDHPGRSIDGRGIGLDRFGLPVQRDRGRAVEPERAGERRAVLAVSGTAALLRAEALRAAALGDGAVLDPRFGSYHEDLDLGLRLARLGWRAAWVAAAQVRHLGSATGGGFRWRHPWWLLANRWRALAGNLTPGALLAVLPRLLRGEARAIRTLVRSNPRSAAVAPAVAASLPVLVAAGWARRSPGPRLRRLPESP